MSKVTEYAFVAVFSILLFSLSGAFWYDAFQSGLIKDCAQLGQSRQGKLHIKCEVVKP